MTRTTEEWIQCYKEKGALWIHDGNLKRPHALLTSGKHSNGFFNSGLVIPDEFLLRDASFDLLELFQIQKGNIQNIDCVVGPQTGATRLARLLSALIMVRTRGDCYWASPAKEEKEGKKSMLFKPEDKQHVFCGSCVLLCEDVITTGGSIDRTVDAVEAIGGVVVRYVLALINRSGLTEISGREIIALIDHSMPMWTPEECPLCKEGSEAIRPKDNWDRLNAQY